MNSASYFDNKHHFNSYLEKYWTHGIIVNSTYMRTYFLLDGINVTVIRVPGGLVVMTGIFIPWMSPLLYLHHKQWQIQDFPEEGATTPRGAPTYNFAKCSQKLHEIERIWMPGEGGRVPTPP